MHQDLCDGRPTLCDKMSPIDGELLKEYLLQVEFQGKSKIYLKEINSY